jgi:hypothetical protein
MLASNLRLLMRREKEGGLLLEDSDPPQAGVLESSAAMGVREPDQLGCGGPPAPGTRGLPPRPMSIV